MPQKSLSISLLPVILAAAHVSALTSLVPQASALCSQSAATRPASVVLSSNTMKIAALSRFAVKGLSPSSLDSVYIRTGGETFPDDRRIALLKKETKRDEEDEEDKTFDAENPKWIHKANFLCAFSAPELMAQYECEYRIVHSRDGSSQEEEEEASRDMSYGSPWDDVAGAGPTQRLLTIWERNGEGNSQKETTDPVLGPVNLATEAGRDATSQFFSEISGEEVVCVSADQAQSAKEGSTATSQEGAHTHQFGNTRSGVKARGDTRTVHIVNAATVRQFSEAIGTDLAPSRFRPNIVVDGLEEWAEFDLIGKSIALKPKDNGSDRNEPMILDIISKTVRCEGVGIDPDDRASGTLAIPQLLSEYFPERGPFLGVYAVVREGGLLSLGDTLQVID